LASEIFIEKFCMYLNLNTITFKYNILEHIVYNRTHRNRVEDMAKYM